MGSLLGCPLPLATPNQLRQLQTTVEKIGQSKMYLFPVHDCADASRTLRDAALGWIQQELDQFRQRSKAPSGPHRRRPSTLARRFDAYEPLRSRAKLYRDILRVQGFDKQLDEMTAWWRSSCSRSTRLRSLALFR